ncbi:MAG: hypothetical protein JETT_1585 [Candidatus Jettenia ecosi]|uniref:Uncharacterized protein n=1 Tax=Candidatus Jettenia ecosi TaxID=2494326 RepID=A0A533QBS8_9BACT|nr:MAG: hypothetical protein JETT_1585 [Candidatus Jettenia ecosi]
MGYNPFQSSSSPKTGCYASAANVDLSSRGFNPHPVRRLDATLATQAIRRILSMFQSSSSPKTGCYMWLSSIRDLSVLFQSSSSPKTGCYIASRLQLVLWFKVSILIQSEDWMLLDCGGCTTGLPPVSILIQSEDWMLRYATTRRNPCIKFQSSSSPKTGCYYPPAVTSTLFTLFQSSSSPKTGCYDQLVRSVVNSPFVSILIQSEDWMLRVPNADRRIGIRFQSSSSPKTGCYATTF